MQPRTKSSPRWLALACSLACGVGLLVPSDAQAFCGFYVAGADAKLFNNATIVVLMRDGTRTVVSMQNEYEGPPEDFALVIPVPVVLQEADVKTLRSELFERVDTLASPRLVEYWEMDPCAPDTIGLGNVGLIGKGGGGGTGSGYGRGAGAATVKVEAEFTVGEYDIVILSATESTGLETWLHDNGYNIPAGAEPLLRPYVQADMKFFVAKVDPTKVKFGGNGKAMLSPLRFHYDSKDFTLPVRLGLINAPDPATGGKQDLLIHILAAGVRYEMANYPNATIPTNLDVKERTKEEFGKFYVSLFDHTLEQHPNAVVTEYAWGAGSCDPCPGPDAALTEQELLELGGDVLPNWKDGLSSATASAPKITMSPPTVSAGLDKDIVRRIVRAHINEVRFCYTTGLASDPTLAGQVDVDFTIASSGKVSVAAVADSTVKDETVESCIAKAVKRWQFPKPTGDAVVTVRFPFVLAPTGGSGGGFGSSAAGAFVLSRLHARYDASGLGEDLVFQAASAISGGREVREWIVSDDGKTSKPGELEQGAIEAGTNNFQARYAVRHPWTGTIACEQPVRDRWGGPPEGSTSEPTVARQLASVGRGAGLGSFVSQSAAKQLGVAVVASEPPTEVPVAEPPKPDKPALADDRPAPPGGCTCSTESSPSEVPTLAGLALLALLGVRRTRKP